MNAKSHTKLRAAMDWGSDMTGDPGSPPSQTDGRFLGRLSTFRDWNRNQIEGMSFSCAAMIF